MNTIKLIKSLEKKIEETNISNNKFKNRYIIIKKDLNNIIKNVNINTEKVNNLEKEINIIINIS
tara:strand:+ start:569 stop:760 length:192 start_codon:yes stop_codon:yes gene_type:complete